MKATIYYTRKNIVGFLYSSKKNPYLLNRNSETAEETPDIEKHYEKVGEMEIDRENDMAALETIFFEYNVNRPMDVTNKIREGELDIDHSSMSVGDIIQLDDRFFIAEVMGFTQIEMKGDSDG